MARSLLEWSAKLDVNKTFLLVTVNGSHFPNIILQNLRKTFRFSQKFSNANNLFTNGQMETMNSSVLINLQQVCSKYKLLAKEWLLLLSIN